VCSSEQTSPEPPRTLRYTDTQSAFAGNSPGGVLALGESWVSSAAMQEDGVNRLLDVLPRKDRQRAVERCETVNLVLGAILCEPDEPFRHVYFPLSGFISLVAQVGGHKPLELGLIGNEGMLGVTLMLGVNTAPQRGVVQGTGTALRMSKQQLDRELRESPHLVRSLNRYLYVLMAQLSQTTACSRFHDVEARLARGLLMTQDRAQADHFHLTHEFLADMLGVRRSAITIAAGGLRRRDLIQYSRGEIQILDRRGLEDASCECYSAVTAQYARAFG
jgi:CRP-like cAMP-binding protein